MQTCGEMCYKLVFTMSFVLIELGTDRMVQSIGIWGKGQIATKDFFVSTPTIDFSMT